MTKFPSNPIVIATIMMISTLPVFAQTCGGDITNGATNNFLDPDGDADIVAVGTGFTNCGTTVDEMNEFEVLVNPAGCLTCQKPWTATAPIEEVDADLWAGGGSCGTTDLVLDYPASGAYTYHTIIDPDGTCDTGDELLVFRIRADAAAVGSFSYSILVDTDGLLGAADPDGVQCASKISNAGFEYEIVANPANNQNIEIRNINGVVGQYGTDPAHSNGLPTAAYPNTTHYNQANACRSECDVATCASGAVYHTFAVQLVDLGLSCADHDLQFGGGTASSGNGTVSSNTSIADVGGAGNNPTCPDATVMCDCCTECADPAGAYYCGPTAGDIDVCLTGCILACTAEVNDVPVELQLFSVR